jgi:hypothetical protein
MSSSVPLIVNPSTSQIQELPSGNDLNLTGSNISAVVAITASGNINTTANVIGGNILSSGAVSTTGNQLAGGLISATGNIITAGYFVGNFAGNVTGNLTVPGSNTQVLFNSNGNAGATAGLTFNTNGPNLLTVLGNVQAGNVLTAGVISATGNIQGNYFIGNGALLTGISGGSGNSTAIVNGLTNISIPGSGSNANVSIGGTTNVVVFTNTGMLVTGIASASGNITGSNLITAGLITASGNISTAINLQAGNVLTGGMASALGNITGGNILTAGQVSAAGNIQGNYFIGNGSLLTGISASYGNSNVVSLLATFGSNVISTTGNITGNYFIGNGSQLTGIVTNYSNANVGSYLTSYTGNITANTISTTGNVTGANILTGGQVDAVTLSATANVIGGNITTAGQVSATGNITGGNISTNAINAGGNISANAFTGISVSVTGNITGGNLNISSGNISTNNTTGYLFDTVTSNIRIGTFNAEYVTIGTAGSQTTIQGNAAVTANIGTNLKGAMLIDADYVYTTTNQQGVMLQVQGQTNLPTRVYIDSVGANNYSAIIGRHYNGNTSSPAQVLANSVVARYGATPYTSNGWPTISTTRIDMYTLENQTATAQGSQIQLWTTPVASNIIARAATVDNTGVSVTGNVTGQYFIGNGSQLTGCYGNSNVTTLLSSFGSNTISTTGNITSGNLSVNTGTVTIGNIVNANGNAVGNIGSSSKYFNTVFAQATTALYADLAECYLADAEYAPGTVLSFGGLAEVTVADTDADPLIAGVVSTNPAHLMNSGLTGTHVVTVALVGRAPCQVQGPVARGAMMVSAGNGRARAEANPAMGTVIGKAVQAFDGDTGTIEIVVGRL